MKSVTLLRRSLQQVILFLVVLILAAAPQAVQAAEAGEPFSHAELSRMLAPVALYPDTVLAQILMASTYPIEVVEADRWLKRNPELEARELDDALLGKEWAPSVKELCHLPSILALMSERIGETTELGNAFLAQEEEVMGVVQALRVQAHKRGRLTTTDKHRVVVTETVIVIEPRDPRVIYVPYYDPCYVFDPWWYPPCPHYYWRPAGVSIRVGIGYWPGFYFGYSFGTWCYFDWHRHVIHIDVHKRPRYVRYDRWYSESGGWIHRPVHRRGVAYRDLPTSRKYRQSPVRAEDVRRELRRAQEERIHERKRLELKRKRQHETGFGSPPAKVDRERTRRPGDEERQRIETRPKREKKGEKGRELKRKRERIDQREEYPEPVPPAREIERERKERRQDEEFEQNSPKRHRDDFRGKEDSGGKGRKGWKGYER